MRGACFNQVNRISRFDFIRLIFSFVVFIASGKKVMDCPNGPLDWRVVRERERQRE